MENAKAKQTAKQIVKEILLDISCRKGMGDEWDALDSDIKKEIKQEWSDIIENILKD